MSGGSTKIRFRVVLAAILSLPLAAVIAVPAHADLIADEPPADTTTASSPSTEPTAEPTFRAAAVQTPPRYVGRARARAYNVTALRIARPSGVRPGDFLLASIELSGRRSIRTPSGWSLIRRTYASSYLTKATYRRWVRSGEPSSYRWTFSRTTVAGGIAAYRGVDRSSPVVRSGAIIRTRATQSLYAPSLLAPAAALHVATFGAARSVYITPRSSYERWEIRAGGSRPMTSEGADRVRSATGYTGSLAARANRSTRYISHSVILRAAPAPADPIPPDPIVPDPDTPPVGDCTQTLSTASGAGFTVPTGEIWCFNPSASTTLTSTGNVIVQGVLRMRPESPDVVHTLRFTGYTETQFIGGGNDVLPTDIGLWVMGAGRLDLVGATKTGWTRLQGGVAAGATSLTLQTPVVGWAPGDELMIAPTRAPTSPSAFQEFDIRRIASVGDTITLESGLANAHPQVSTWTAEVANLTRNVRIEGQDATHRSHVYIRSTVPQVVRNVAIRYVGPRKDTNGDGSIEFVPGRYGLHFHRSVEGSRGSLIESVVIRDAGSHAFVPHNSHGIRFHDTVSYNTLEEPYWYDPEPGMNSANDTDPPLEAPSDTTYDHALAARATDASNHRLSGFFLGGGTGNVVRNSAAVGINGGIDSSGFKWPEDRQGVWTFEDNIAHNNARNGIFTWQNSPFTHVITRFAGYHNGNSGIEHGAYTNGYVYQDSVLYGNLRSNVELHAESINSPRMTFGRLTLNGAGITQYAYLIQQPTLDGYPAIVCANSISGHTTANYHINYSGMDDTIPQRLDIRASC